MNIFKKIINLASGKNKIEEKSLVPICIKESRSPNCPMYARLEQNDYCTYMYLHELDQDRNPKRIVSFGWIRNHEKSPEKIQVELMKNGLPSMLPSEFCAHPEGRPKFNPDDLEFVWFEEGDGVALLENDEIINIMPCWSSNDLSPSYSKECIKAQEILFPLNDDNALIPRVRKAQEFWKMILKDQEDWWEQFRTPRLEILQDHLGDYKNYYAIDGGNWPAKAMLRYEIGDMTYLITVGVAMIPQPQVELYVENPGQVRRIELGFAIKTEEMMNHEKEYCVNVSSTTNLPWYNIAWLGHGHTLDASVSLSFTKEQAYMVLVDSKFDKSLPQISFPDFRGDSINILWLRPISEPEFKFIKENGINAFLEKSV